MGQNEGSLAQRGDATLTKATWSAAALALGATAALPSAFLSAGPNSASDLTPLAVPTFPVPVTGGPGAGSGGPGASMPGGQMVSDVRIGSLPPFPSPPGGPAFPPFPPGPFPPGPFPFPPGPGFGFGPPFASFPLPEMIGRLAPNGNKINSMSVQFIGSASGTAGPPPTADFALWVKFILWCQRQTKYFPPSVPPFSPVSPDVPIYGPPVVGAVPTNISVLAPYGAIFGAGALTQVSTDYSGPEFFQVPGAVGPVSPWDVVPGDTYFLQVLVGGFTASITATVAGLTSIQVSLG